MAGFSTAYRTAGQAWQATAREKTAKTLSIGRLTLWTSAITLALGLWVVPQEARADACKATNINAKPGCVTPSDIGTVGKKKKRKPALGQKDRKDEAGVAFDDNPLQDKRVEFSGGLGPTDIFTGFKSKVPAAGVIVVRASALLITEGNTFGAVGCDILANGTVFNNIEQRIKGFSGSVDVPDGIPHDNMAFLTAFEVDKKGTLSLDMVCGLVNGVPTNAIFDVDKKILMNSPSLVAQYFPTRYCRKKRNGTCR